MQTTEFKNVPLKDIKADPHQPRTFYDEEALKELTASVSEKGVIQPILLRPNGKGYLIVCGERRYRAAASVAAADKARNTIPAIIREITDDEALQLQIIENLQRKDVHPMEEAVAFKSLMESGKEVKEIAAKVAKSEYYVRQRIKLCSLISEWQKIFFKNKINITLALKLAMLEDEAQAKLFEDNGSDEEIEIGEWEIEEYNGDLSEAPFSLSDAILNPEMGACINCQYNSHTALLFPAEDIEHVCSNTSCYKIKCDANFVGTLKEAQESSDIVFIDMENDSKEQFVKMLTDAGFDVLKRGDWTRAYGVDKPDYEEFKEEYLLENDDDDSGLSEAWDKEMESYNDDVKELEDLRTAGRMKKAFVVTGNNRGSYIDIILSDKAATSVDGSTPAAAGAQNFDAEIDRLKVKETRAKELDEQKIWEMVKTHFNPHANASVLKGEFDQVEREAIATALRSKLNYHNRSGFDSLFADKKKGFQNITEEQLRQMIRYYMLDILPPVTLYSGYNDEAKLSLKIASQYFPTVLKKIEDEQKVIADKRIARLDQKIADLKKAKKEAAKK